MRSQAFDSFKLLVAVIVGLVLLIIGVSMMQAPGNQGSLAPSKAYIEQAFS